MSTKAKAKARPKAKAKSNKARKQAAKWSQRVMEKSDAMDLKTGVFKLRSARAIAQPLKRSAEASDRRKSTPFRSSMSMLNFEINRAGKNLGADRLKADAPSRSKRKRDAPLSSKRGWGFAFGPRFRRLSLSPR